MNTPPHPLNVEEQLPKLTIDPDAHAAYIQVLPAGTQVASTREFSAGHESVIVDLDPAGRVIGIEILDFSTHIPIRGLAETYKFSEKTINALQEFQQKISITYARDRELAGL